MLGLFQVVQSAGAWPGVHSMPKSVMAPKPMEIPLHGRPRLPHASPDGEARPEIGRGAADTGTVRRLQGELGGGVVGLRSGEVVRGFSTTPPPRHLVTHLHGLARNDRLALLVAH